MGLLASPSTASFANDPPVCLSLRSHLSTHELRSRLPVGVRRISLTLSTHSAFPASSSRHSSLSSFCCFHLNFKELTASAPGSHRCRRLTVTTKASRDSVDARDRLVAALGYFLPFLDGLQYGRHLFMRFPVLESLFQPLFPLLQTYKSVPYANFVLFFALYLAVVRNPSFSRYVRFNTMQAVVLDVLLSLPIIIERILSPRRRLGIQLLVMFYNSVFVFLVACVTFGIISCLLGKTPRLPFVADAADAQI